MRGFQLLCQLLIILLLILLCCCDNGATIYCHVYDNVDGTPLNGASVTRAWHIDDTTYYNRFGRTGGQGKYVYDVIGDLPAGDVIITHVGYYPDTIAVPYLEAGKSTSIASYLCRLPTSKEGFSILTSTDRQIYHMQDTVQITVTAVNNADTTFVKNLGAPCTLLYAVLNEDDELIYDPFVCAAVLGVYILEPYQTEQRYHEWDLSDPLNIGQPVIPGLYKIFGRLDMNTVIAGDTIAIQVLD